MLQVNDLPRIYWREEVVPLQTMTSDELCSMQIINLCGGTCLGTPESLEIRCGCDSCVITALIVPCETGLASWLPFGKHTVWRIPWERVECIGEDAILVRLPADVLAGCCQTGHRCKNS